MVDLDGVCYNGAVPVPHAARSLTTARSAGMRPVFVTNNASRSPAEVAAKLTAMGVRATEGDVFTSAQAAAALAAADLPAGSAVLVVGTRALRDAVTEAGLRPVDRAADAPVAVVQGFGPQVSWQELAEAAYAIGGGAVHYATNLDLTLPTERGIAPGNGSLVGAVVNATGRAPRAAGKPQPAIYRQALARAGAGRGSSDDGAPGALAVGDRLDTDLAGAAAAGIPGMLVLTGVHGPREAIVAPVGSRPSLLAADLRGLLVDHPAPQRRQDAWWCRQAHARVVDGRLQVVPGTADADGVDWLRAACAAAWDAADRGEDLDPTCLEDLPALRPA